MNRSQNNFKKLLMKLRDKEYRLKKNKKGN